MPRSLITPIIITLALFFSASGCASKNYSSTLQPAAHCLADLPAQFRIDRVDDIPPHLFFATGFTDDDYWAEHVADAAPTERFPQQLRDMVAAKCPAVFSDAPDALRIDVRFTVTKFRESSTQSWLLTAVSWGVFGLILPLPIIMQYDCAMQLSFPDLPLEQTMIFRNRLIAWVSFPSPLALLPIPLQANRRASVLYPWQTSYYSGRRFTLESFAEAVLQAIEKIDATRLNKAYQSHARRIRNDPARRGPAAIINMPVPPAGSDTAKVTSRNIHRPSSGG